MSFDLSQIKPMNSFTENYIKYTKNVPTDIQGLA